MARYKPYTVRRGRDNFADIATELGIPTSALVGANPGVYSIRPGQIISAPEGELGRPEGLNVATPEAGGGLPTFQYDWGQLYEKLQTNVEQFSRQPGAWVLTPSIAAASAIAEAFRTPPPEGVMTTGIPRGQGPQAVTTPTPTGMFTAPRALPAGQVQKDIDLTTGFPRVITLATLRNEYPGVSDTVLIERMTLAGYVRNKTTGEFILERPDRYAAEEGERAPGRFFNPANPSGNPGGWWIFWRNGRMITRLGRKSRGGARFRREPMAFGLVSWNVATG